MNVTTEKIEFASSREFKEVISRGADCINLLASSLAVNISEDGLVLSIQGDAVTAGQAVKFVNFLRALRSGGTQPCDVGMKWLNKCIELNSFDILDGVKEMSISVGPGHPPVLPRTFGQIKYLETIRDNDIVLASGSAGSGKTFLAVAVAVHCLLSNKYDKIILTRPAVESGENLGFLPGNLEEKILPYLRPLYDSLDDTLSSDDLDRLTRKGKIEIAPLAYMRGRTLNNAFVILDEAQNATTQQMLMFLTRLGYRSKCVACGDVSQVDLPNKHMSGLQDAMNRLHGVSGIGMHTMSNDDIVRHRLVREIIQAYEKDISYL